MKVILLDNIRALGRVGDTKSVNDGYARNFLIPRGLAKAATEGAAKEADALKADRLNAHTLATHEAKALAERLTGTSVTVKGKASEHGTLFAGISSDVLANAISRAAGVHVTPEQLHPHDHLKTVGDHSVTVGFPGGNEVDVSVVIEATGN